MEAEQSEGSAGSGGQQEREELGTQELRRSAGENKEEHGSERGDKPQPPDAGTEDVKR